MATTNNGYTIAPRGSSLLTSIKVGTQKATVRAGHPGWLLRWVTQQLHAAVEPVATLNGWRDPATNAKAGGVRDSNHLSGTALDYNGARHRWEAKLPANQRGAHFDDGWTNAQTAKVHAILAATNHTVQWGADVSARYPIGQRDAMHFEIRGSAAEVTKAVARLNKGSVKVTTDVLLGRSGPSTSAKVLHRRRRGYQIAYTSTVWRDGHLWLRTRFGTYYAADDHLTTWEK